MVVQKDSAKGVVAKCKKNSTKVVAGGPLFTSGCEGFDVVDHFVLGEAEITLPLFLEDLEKGHARHIYASNRRPDISKTPVPL
jgi:radical SAM superfamily enzyme YgiQ (UPF0313 family)